MGDLSGNYAGNQFKGICVTEYSLDLLKSESTIG